MATNFEAFAPFPFLPPPPPSAPLLSAAPGTSANLAPGDFTALADSNVRKRKPTTDLREEVQEKQNEKEKVQLLESQLANLERVHAEREAHMKTALDMSQNKRLAAQKDADDLMQRNRQLLKEKRELAVKVEEKDKKIGDLLRGQATLREEVEQMRNRMVDNRSQGGIAMQKMQQAKDKAQKEYHDLKEMYEAERQRGDLLRGAQKKAETAYQQVEQELKTTKDRLKRILDAPDVSPIASPPLPIVSPTTSLRPPPLPLPPHVHPYFQFPFSSPFGYGYPLTASSSDLPPAPSSSSSPSFTAQQPAWAKAKV